MSNVALLRGSAQRQPAEVRQYLGPAVVTAVDPHEVEVSLKDGDKARAVMALASPYAPAPGDVVLVIGNQDGHYVIGVLHGTGKAVLEFQGDVDVRAVGGVLRLAGDRGVEVAAPEVSMQAGTLRVIAGAVVQKFTSIRQRVTELLSVHAGETHTVVDGSAYAQSKRATMLTEDKMTINGKEIYLG
jgi:hypothetical protein